MSKLDSITLSNLRKFGSEVTIKLSPGATILLAPNGTGKTTVFEAIEFGLTGKIARLSDNLFPIIRDGANTAKVSLSFTEMTATAEITPVGDVIQTGDLSALFPEISAADIPFLLRLTHLLDQRENEWIVKAEEKDAGSQLARLPIGRDGSRASVTLASVRRSLNEQKSNGESLLNSLAVDLNEWNRLIQERDLARANATGALRPRELIISAISDTAFKTQSLNQIPSGLLNEPVNQEELTIVHKLLSDILQTKIDQFQALNNGISDVERLAENFTIEQARLKSLTQDQLTMSDILNTQTNKVTKFAASIQEEQTNANLAQQQRIVILQQLERLAGENTVKQQIEQHKEALSTATTSLTQAEENCRLLREKYEHHQQIISQHNLISAQLHSLSEAEARLQVGKKMVTQWQVTEDQLNQLTKQIGLAQDQFHQSRIHLNNELSAHEGCKTTEAHAKAHYHALSASVDAIRMAVASIAEHLPPDQGSCPVCGESHGSVELQARVAKALQAIDPNLISSEQQLRMATEKLAASEIAVSIAQESVQANQKQLAALESDQQTLERQVSEFRVDQILASDSVLLAEDSIRQRLDDITTARQDILNKQSALEPPMSQDLLKEELHIYNAALHALDEARLRKNEATTRFEQSVALLAALIAGESLTQTLDDLSVERARLDQLITELNGKIETSKIILGGENHHLLEITNSIERIEAQIKQTQNKLSKIRTDWQELALPGDPLAETTQVYGEHLRTTLINLENHAKTLENIGIEISAWAKLNESQLAQRLIDAQRLELSEDDFFAKLNNQINDAQKNFTRLSQLSEAMDSLDRFLKLEIGNVQKHVSKVVPRWQTLLKRVVRDPRFHQASLKFFSAYNKERAGVSVPLSGKEVSVPDVASEAQLTDLQLTFLLAMAMSHQWSPWKALLLDDPTQHHDLVHASAVFDVLRDYIVDHNFQVVIATHDALQARYFLRKLQNDGIDAKIWTLVPTMHGVTAQEGNWSQRIR